MISEIHLRPRVTVCTHSERMGHNCAYVDWRNQFIAEAEEYANAFGGESSEQWDRLFLGRMDYLTRKARHRGN